MSTINISEIKKLSVAERIQLVEEIWDTIVDDPDSLPVTAAQRAELDRRLRDYQANPEQGRPWDEVRKDLGKD